MIKTCGNCKESKKPLFRLITYKEGRSVSRYFCSYTCLLYDVVGALKCVGNTTTSQAVYDQLKDIVEIKG